MEPSGRDRRGRPWSRHPLVLAASVVVVATPLALGWLRTREATEPPPPTPTPTATADPSPEASPDDHTSLVAQAEVPRVDVYDRRDDPEPSRSLEHPTEVGAPLVFLVEKERGDWLKVLLPVRPNGSTGWIRADQVSLTEHDYRIEVYLDRHRLKTFKGDDVILSTAIAVGTQDTPTPGGRYYIKELLQPPDPTGPYGTYAYGLSGFSNVLKSFAGGEGVIGIHGTNDPSLIGQDVSAGCIRVTNKAIETLVPVLPLGTPVEIYG